MKVVDLEPQSLSPPRLSAATRVYYTAFFDPIAQLTHLFFVSAGCLMENSARLYHCSRCRRRVIICRACDRGQIYCPGPCAGLARATSLRAAAQRYRQTRQGKLRQALRQQPLSATPSSVNHKK